MLNRAAAEYLQKINNSNSEELLDFVGSQCLKIEKYLSAAATVCVSILPQCCITRVWS